MLNNSLLNPVKTYFNKMVYAIAYPFWPKKMKELIKKYKAEGTLNENWFEAHRPLLTILFLVNIGGLAILMDERKIEYLLFFPILPFLCLWLHCRGVFKDMIAPYSYGKPRLLNVYKIRYGWSYISKIIFKDTTTGNIYKSYHRENYFKLKYAPKIGNDIQVYVTESKKYGVAPDIDYIKKGYSLTTKIFNNN